MRTPLELPESLYDQAQRAAGLKGVSVEQFITGILEEKLRADRSLNGNRQRVRLPLVPSAQPGTRPLTAERVAEILNDDDDSG